jgi:hypothetical protein
MAARKTVIRVVKGKLTKSKMPGLAALMRKAFRPSSPAMAKKGPVASPRGVCSGWCRETITSGKRTLHLKRCKVTWDSRGGAEVRCIYG